MYLEENEPISPTLIKTAFELKKDGKIWTQHQSNEDLEKNREKIFESLAEKCKESLPQARMDPYMWRMYQYERDRVLGQTEKFLTEEQDLLEKNTS